MKPPLDTPLVCQAANPPLEESILFCRAAVQLAPTATGEMMYMPGGLQTITPVAGAEGVPITVCVDANGVAELNRQHAAIVARGDKPMFDFNHEDGAASFWPEEYVWRDAPTAGIYCRGEWSRAGKDGVEGKEWRFFSPVFHVSKKVGATLQNPARIVCRAQAKPNMGGLVNDPAFHSILPLWAKNAPGAHPDPKTNYIMNEQQLAALQARNTELQNEINALKAKNSADNAAEIRAKEAEVKTILAQLAADRAEKEVVALKARNKEQDDAIKARNKVDAEGAVQRAVQRGAIAAKDDKTQGALVAKATEDPSFLSVIDAMQGNPALGGRITPPGVVIVAEAPNATLKAFAAICARNAAISLGTETAKAKGQLAREAAALFAKDINGNEVLHSITVEEAIKAADVTDAQVGLLAGTLVLQRALPLLQYEYPLLSSITQDFSDAPGLYGQTETTRIILKPAVQTYDASTDSAGRPKGWVTVSPAQSVDISITLDEHVGIPIVFGVQTLAKTLRNLFSETAPMALYALGQYAVNKLTALMTAANFNAYKQITDAGCVTATGSTAITLATTAGVYKGQEISGAGIPSNTYIASVTDGTHAVMTQAATATATVTATLGGGRVPNLYPTYIKALADFNMSCLGDIKAAFDVNEVPMQERFALLNASYHQKLTQDPTFNTFWAAMHKPDVITEGRLPKLQGIFPQEAPWFPTTSNRVGYAGQKASLCLKTRLPQDFTQAVGAMVPGSVTTVTAPGGISVLLVQYVSLQGNYSEWRPEVMLGAAVGDRRGGLVITSA